MRQSKFHRDIPNDYYLQVGNPFNQLSPLDRTIPERGAAGISLELTGGCITMTHSDGSLLSEHEVANGTWSEMFHAIRFVLDKNTLISEENDQ